MENKLDDLFFRLFLATEFFYNNLVDGSHFVCVLII